MIYKFRSMTTHSEDAGARLAAKEDARITPVGRVIRAIHFDELPQLFNILKGEMSVVTPPGASDYCGSVYGRNSGIRTPAESKSRTDRVCTGIWKV